MVGLLVDGLMLGMWRRRALCAWLTGLLIRRRGSPLLLRGVSAVRIVPGWRMISRRAMSLPVFLDLIPYTLLHHHTNTILRALDWHLSLSSSRTRIHTTSGSFIQAFASRRFFFGGLLLLFSFRRCTVLLFKSLPFMSLLLLPLHCDISWICCSRWMLNLRLRSWLRRGWLVNYTQIPKHQITDQNLLVEGSAGVRKFDVTQPIDSAFDMYWVASITHRTWWFRSNRISLRARLT